MKCLAEIMEITLYMERGGYTRSDETFHLVSDVLKICYTNRECISALMKLKNEGCEFKDNVIE